VEEPNVSVRDAGLGVFRNAFARDAGLRIDHLLLSPSLKNRLVAGGVAREVRSWEKTAIGSSWRISPNPVPEESVGLMAKKLKMTMGLFGTLPPTLEASANPARIFLWQSIQESYQCPA
jgi:hypothetical protein